MADNSAHAFFYRIIGGAENGPITVEQLGRLIVDKRVTAITQVRESACLIWKYAADFSSLAQFFAPKQQNTTGDPFSKPLAQLTAKDVPAMIRPYLRTGTNWAFFFFYVPTTLGVLFQSAVLLIGGRSIRDMYATLGLKLPQILPGWLLVAMALCVVAVCVGPLVVWMAYAKRYLSWARFVLTAASTYIIPLAMMALLALICYEHEMRWTTGMMNQWLPPSP